MIRERLETIKYTWEHKKAFLRIEKTLRGSNSLRGYLHDMDKIVLKIFLPEETVHQIHVKRSKHHRLAHKREDYIQMVIDWECARYTKPDKPLNARETLYKYYPELESKIVPILDEFGL